jgi:hypothetical protein
MITVPTSPQLRRSFLIFCFCVTGVAAETNFASAQDSSAAAPDDTLASPWGITSSASSSRTYPDWFPKMQAAGVTWCRMFADWGSFEPKKSEWNMGAADKMLDAAAAHNIHLSGMFLYSAKWAYPPGAKGAAFPMGHLDDWAEYCGKVVERYKDRVHYWEIWNEGNGGFHGHYPDGHWDTDMDYAKLASGAYTAIKQSDPNAQVGLSVASFDPAYIDQVLQDEAKLGKPESFDYFCIHPYETMGLINEADGEIPYLWMAKTLRDAIKVDAPDRKNPEIWITEVGRPIGNHKESKEADNVTPELAADTLVKAYIMAIAQGINRVCWFEAQDPHGEPPGYGILDINGETRPGYLAMKAMTSSLGETPKYLGWLALGQGNKSYGFAFQGAKGPALVLWMPTGETDNTITFGGNVTVVEPKTGSSSPLGAGQTLALGDSPVIVTDLPADLAAQAQANGAKNFPWGGDFSNTSTVSIQLGDPNANNGITQVSRDWTKPYKFDDGSTGALVSPPGHHDNQNIKFYVHPSFANLKTQEYYLRVTARRIAPYKTAKMSLVYEVANSRGGGPMRVAGRDTSVANDTDYKGGIEGETFALENNTKWQTHTWHLTDAAFAKMWGYDFAFLTKDSDPFVIGKVEVSTKPFTN